MSEWTQWFRCWDQGFQKCHPFSQGLAVKAHPKKKRLTGASSWCLDFSFSSVFLASFSFLPQTRIPVTSTLWAINTNSLNCRLELPPLFLSDQSLALPHLSFQTQSWRTSNGRSLAGYWENSQFHCLSLSRGMNLPVSAHNLGQALSWELWTSAFR